MKHIEVLNLICKYRKIIDEAYRSEKKALISIPNELVEIGLFNKIGSFYYLNEAYINLVDTLLVRVDYSYVAEDFEKELKRLVELKEEYKLKKANALKELILKLINQIYQGMLNRDKKVLALIEKLENDELSSLDLLISEAKRILADVEDIMIKNEKIVEVFRALMEFSEFSEFIKDIFIDIIHLNENVDSFLKRLREFISQTEKKRKLNQKLLKISYMILEENSKIENYLKTKRFVLKQKFEYVPDSAYINYEKVKEIVGKFTKKKDVKKSIIKRDLQEVIELINIKKLIEYVKGSDDIFLSIIEYIGKIDKKLLNESVRVFVYILNHYDKKLEYKNRFNKFNVKVVKWKK
ncbi:hypothetical protein [Caminibacter mediatlanticus]|uniref:Uncharacterized protein n=1 Tax=Caminibacter mediatlanticus TB-2 TaxID=391592 RepID=A0AAI9F1U2_9BACT|nr:hypothetical protein [Caminibacter mediatlanticus]EDM23104.1 hypothetical protein CMTB2_00234 [Caminibacter mediatlanticus TB-2]